VSRLQAALVGIFVLLFVARALDIGRRYNHTFDEPTQIASGLELWQYGTFVLHDDAPPLAKLLVSAPAYLAGVRLDAPPERAGWKKAHTLLYRSGRYWFVLRSARAVNTVVGALLVILLAWTAASAWGGWAGVAAACAAGFSPGVVSAASIANSDVLGVLSLLVTLLAFRRLLRRGDLAGAALFALALAAALVSKLSALPFLAFALPVMAAFIARRQVWAALRHPLAFSRAHAAVIAAIVVIVPFAIWAAYGFHLAPPVGELQATTLAQALRPRAPWLASLVGHLWSVPLPLGGFARGVGVAYNIARLGHPAYFMGEYSLHGWPTYFLVTLLLKVPLGFLAAVLASTVLAVRRRGTAEGREVLLWLCTCAAILASVSRAGINAGHRHVLVVEALFALVAAGGIAVGLGSESRRGRLAGAVITAALLLGAAASLRAHPDALGYTNLLAGRDPDWWFVDSNLDWGQDLERLRKELAARGISDEIHFAYFGAAEPERHGIRFRDLAPGERATGWIAVSVHYLRGMRDSGVGSLPDRERREGYAWLLREVPVARIGTSIRLYHLAGSEAQAHDRR